MEHNGVDNKTKKETLNSSFNFMLRSYLDMVLIIIPCIRQIAVNIFFQKFLYVINMILKDANAYPFVLIMCKCILKN